MAYSFRKPERRDRMADPSLTDDQRAFKERERRDRERYELATDGDCTICFCFHDAGERSRFASIAAADAEGYCYGDILRRLFEDRIGIKHVKSFRARPVAVGVFPDPLEGMEPTDDLEADCFAEAEAILRAFESVEAKPRYDIVWDSAYYITGIFRDHTDKARFIADFALAKFGETFMDGSAVLGYLGV
ncbi:hypothetical protein EII22_08915 [Coriobacteriales bacterium OH1046]|nr:hypothetical protein EII22_08915 [Coriobacteriales bacterium OH1046]